MLLVTALLVIGVACAIAAWFVIREAGRMAAEPPPPVFDIDEAYDWVVEHVPDDVAATLTPDDVRRILDFQLEFFQRKGVAGNGSTCAPAGRRRGRRRGDGRLHPRPGRETGEAYLPEQVHAVIETQLAYLREIGAVGPQAGPSPATGSVRSPAPPDCAPTVRRQPRLRAAHERLLQPTPRIWYNFCHRRKEVVQHMHDKSGTLEVRGR